MWHQVHRCSPWRSCTNQTGRILTCGGPRRSIYSCYTSLLNMSLEYRLLLSSTCVSLQWQPLIQDLQAEEEHPRGLPPVWATETRWGNAGQRELEAGCHVAWGRGSQWVDCCQQWVDEHNKPIYRKHHSGHKLPFNISKHKWSLYWGWTFTSPSGKRHKPTTHTTKLVNYWSHN